MSPPDPGPRRARLVATLIAILALLAIGAWWLQREGRPRIEPLGGDGDADRMPAALAAPAMATPELLEAPAQREPDQRRSKAQVIGDSEPHAEAASAPAKPLLLHVVDVATGAELREVTVERYDSDLGLPIGSLRPSGSLEMLVAKGAAPLRLEPPEQQPLVRDTLLVHAAGYEQATLNVDWTSGGERTLELRPAGGLDLDLEGAPAEMQFTVRLYSIDAVAKEAERSRRRIERARAFEADMATELWSSQERKQRNLSYFAADLYPWIPSPEVARLLRTIEPQRVAFIESFSVCRVDHLAAGRWAVAVFDASQDHAKLPPLHAYGRCDIVAGRRTSLTLECAPRPLPPAPERVVLRGRVHFDRGWLAPGMGSLPTSVTLQALATGESGACFNDDVARLEDGATPDEKRFESVALPPGPAIATFVDWPYRVRFAVPELLEGAVEPPLVEFAIPPPIELTVRAIGRRGDSDLLAARVEATAANEPSALFSTFSKERSNDGAPLLLRLPAGHWRIHARPDEDASWSTLFERRVERSGETIDLALRDTAFVELEFHDGAAIVPIESEWVSGFAASGPSVIDGALGGRGSSMESSWSLAVDGEGPALLHLEEPPGYAPIAPLEVELVRGESVRVSVALERLRR